MNQTASTSQAVIAVALIAAAAIVGVVIVLALRRRLLGRAEVKGSDEISLAALRSLRERGQLNEEEFAKARDVVLRSHGVQREAGRAPTRPAREANGEGARPRAE